MQFIMFGKTYTQGSTNTNAVESFAKQREKGMEVTVLHQP